MSVVEEIHARISEKLNEIKEICDEYKYDVTPTLLLRHPKGPSVSMVIGNDDLSMAILCIAELGDIGEVVEDESAGDQ